MIVHDRTTACPRLAAVCASSLVQPLDRTLVSHLSRRDFTASATGLRYGPQWPQCSRSARRRSRVSTRSHEYDDCSTAPRPRLAA
eukprot:2149439-Prymnesium_polylepis.1